MEKSNWNEFQNAGLLLFVNTFLHIFGWSIVCEIDAKTKEVTKAYPVKNFKWRGFSQKHQFEAYEELTNYVSSNINEISKPFLKDKK